MRGGVVRDVVSDGWPWMKWTLGRSFGRLRGERSLARGGTKPGGGGKQPGRGGNTTAGFGRFGGVFFCFACGSGKSSLGYKLSGCYRAWLC